ncbi:MAG: lactate utilization protein [Bacteroidales bacterium]|jgi:L-lactate dehydrogenase complex protein LldG|nr:lactate utilization protein [Bacteroidales bacterium]
MNSASAKEKMLKSIRDALIERAPDTFHDLDLKTSVYHDSKNALDIEFAENFIRTGGKFVYCEDVQEAVDSIRFFTQQENWDKIYCAEETLQRILTLAGLPFTDNPKELIVRKVGMMSCEFLIARTGSILFSSQPASGRRILSVLDTQIVIGTVAQIQPDLKSAFQLIKEKYAAKMPSMFSIVNGLSKIKDIDGEEEQGLGAKQLFLFLIDTTTEQKS